MGTMKSILKKLDKVIAIAEAVAKSCGAGSEGAPGFEPGNTCAGGGEAAAAAGRSDSDAGSSGKGKGKGKSEPLDDETASKLSDSAHKWVNEEAPNHGGYNKEDLAELQDTLMEGVDDWLEEQDIAPRFHEEARQLFKEEAEFRVRRLSQRAKLREEGIDPDDPKEFETVDGARYESDDEYNQRQKR